MSYLRKIQHRLLVSVLIAVLLFPSFAPGKENQKLLVWWGTLYPQFCFMDKPEDRAEEAQPRFHFWIIEFVQKSFPTLLAP